MGGLIIVRVIHGSGQERRARLSANGQQGGELMHRPMTLNSRHPGWYWFPFVADFWTQ